jgi:hypothetical protein
MLAQLIGLDRAQERIAALRRSPNGATPD